jgi:hypothetical protein
LDEGLKGTQIIAEVLVTLGADGLMGSEFPRYFVGGRHQIDARGKWVMITLGMLGGPFG